MKKTSLGFVLALLAGPAWAQTVAIDHQTTDGTSSISRLQIYTTTGVGAIATMNVLQSRLGLSTSAYLNLSTSTAAASAGDIRYTSGSVRFHDGTAERVLARLADGATTFSSGAVLFGNGTAAIQANETRIFWDNSSYRLGLNTSSPSYDVSFGGNSARYVALERHTTSDTAGNNFSMQAGGATSGATNKNGGALMLQGGTATGNGTSEIWFLTAGGGSSGTSDSNTSTRMVLDGLGRLGIGDTSPDGKLDVESTGAVTSSNYGVNLSNLTTNTTTDGINKYGVYVTSTGSFTGSTGAATNNYGLYVDTVSGGDYNFGAAFVALPVLVGTSTWTQGDIGGTLVISSSSTSDTAFKVPVYSLLTANPTADTGQGGYVGFFSRVNGGTAYLGNDSLAAGQMSARLVNSSGSAYNLSEATALEAAVACIKTSGGSTTITSATGVTGKLSFLDDDEVSGSGGVVTTFASLRAGNIDGTGTATTYYGLLVDSPQGGGTVTSTNCYGVFVDSINTGTNRTGIYVEDASGGGGTNYALWVDAGVSRFDGNVGIGTTSPGGRLHLAGALSSAAWGTEGIQLRGEGSTYTDTSTAASGTATNAVFSSFGVPNLAATNSSVTTTNAATLYVAGAPTAGTNMTITNPYAFWVDAGTTRLDGSLIVGGGSAVTKIMTATATLDLANATAQTSSEATVTVTDAAVGDAVFLGIPGSPDANSCFTAWVSAANTVTVRFNNYSSGPINPASGSYRVVVVKF